MRWGQAIRERPGTALFLGAVIVYNLNLLPVISGDTAPAALLPFSVLFHHSINFDAYAAWLMQAYGGPPYFLQPHDGHFYSVYPVVQPLLLTPLYTPLLLVPGLRDWPVESIVLLARVLEKLMASLIAAACVATFFDLLRRLVDGRQAAMLTLVLAFATGTWSVASQALWQHGASELMIVLSLLCVQKIFAGESSRAAIIGAGVWAALSVAMRPTNLLLFAISVAVLLAYRADWRVLASYALSGVAIGGALAAYNLAIFGSLRGGYTEPFDGQLWSGLSGLLFSPGRGLFVYSPVLLFVLPGVYLWLRTPGPIGGPVYVISLAFSIAHTLVYAKWPAWWGGSCFGPRYLTDALPCLVVLLAPLSAVIPRNALLRGSFVSLLALSAYIQFLGAFNYPESNWETPERSVDHHPERVWDWSDNPIRHSIAAGMNGRGYAFVCELVESRLSGRPVEVHLRVR